jgi:hypothetical protein
MKTKIRNSISGLLLIPLVVACFALLPSVQATPDPASVFGNNTADGAGALANPALTGTGNTAFGSQALNKLTTGNNNNAQGNGALQNLTTGGGNAAIGSLALQKLQTGIYNTAVGNTALNALTDGVRNTAVGYGTLRSGNFSDTTAVGWAALLNNTANSNTAVGSAALFSNTIAIANTAIGEGALFSSTEGGANTATGAVALLFNTIGDENTAIGAEALLHNIDGDENTAIGRGTLFEGQSGNANTAIGYEALFLCTGSFNTALGRFAGGDLTNGSGNVCIGSDVFGVAGESNTTRIRNVYASVAATRAVYVTSSNKLGTLASSERFKAEIKPMDKASEAILALKPVSFRYKQEVDPDCIPMFGLVAEEVEKVNPDLVSRDEEGKAFTVRYEAVNAMLLNEFLKEHRTVQEQGATIAELRKGMEVLAATVKEQAAQIQKVSAQLEVSKPAPQIVLTDQ